MITLDQMRSDIAALLHEQPEAIGDSDNLMDLGLDSMRAMNLVFKWREAGVALEFADLAEHVTLADWWKIVSARQEVS